MKTRVFLIFMLFALPATFLLGQKSNKKITITGTVTDINKKPVSGATIFVDNRSTDKVTHINGSYKVKAKSDDKMIRVKSISGKEAEAAINGNTEINFSLPFDVLSEANMKEAKMSEKEVNIGYGNVDKKNLISPVGQVDETSIKDNYYQTIYDMLRNQPGVQVNGTSVNIQGATSFMLSTEPLYVVDGIPVNSIEYIDPHMVKSIEILKGPSAAIYGSRGANGVVLITLIGASGVR